MLTRIESFASLARTSLGVVWIWWMASDSLSKLICKYLLDNIYNKIVTPCFDSLAIRHRSYNKNTSSHYWYALGFKGKHKC